MSLQPIYENVTDWRESIRECEQFGFEVSALFAGYRDPMLRLSEIDCVMVKI
jgi:hypothetical protein